MNSVSLLAPAKINLYLKIVGDRLDGYHELVMLMQSIELSDILRFHLNGTENIRLFCDNPQVPTDQSNLIFKAVNLLKDKYRDAYHNFGGVDITLDKRIPIAAGVAGGSGNAAATLVGLNLLWKLNLNLEQLTLLAAKLGSDVPFSLVGGTALATGRGEKLQGLPPLEQLWLVLAKYESLGISTAWAYQTYRKNFSHTYGQNKQENFPLLDAVIAKDFEQIGKLLHNDLEKVVLVNYPQVQNLRDILGQFGTIGTMMSGSGPSVFTLCRTEQEALQIQQQLKSQINDSDLKIWTTRLIGKGIQIIGS